MTNPNLRRRGKTGLYISTVNVIVTISCPQKGVSCWKACATSREFQDLLEISAKKFGIVPAKVLTITLKDAK